MSEREQVSLPNDFVNLLTRVVNGKEHVILHDAEGRPIAALVPIEDSLDLNACSPNSSRRKGKTRRKSLPMQDVLAAARALVAEQAGPLPPWEAIKADPLWQQRWDDLLASIRSHIPPDVTPEEIEADIREACDEVRRERLARHS